MDRKTMIENYLSSLSKDIRNMIGEMPRLKESIEELIDNVHQEGVMFGRHEAFEEIRRPCKIQSIMFFAPGDTRISSPSQFFDIGKESRYFDVPVAKVKSIEAFPEKKHAIIKLDGGYIMEYSQIPWIAIGRKAR